jgi:hypothetical protein
MKFLNKVDFLIKLNFLRIKNKILYGIAVVVIAAVAAWNVSVNLNSQDNSELSDIDNTDKLTLNIGNELSGKVFFITILIFSDNSV